MRLLPAPLGSASSPSDVRVSVVVPARNEAERLPRLLASLPSSVEVVVVDDGSTDGTGELAAARGAAVVRVDGPPPGWNGKPWACEQGVAAAGGELLVLLDADVWLAPGALGRLVHAHAALAADGLLSVEPHHVTERAYEQLSAWCNAVTVLAAGDRTAFGPCLVTTPGALAAVGGFGAVASESIEDIALGQAYESAGRPVRTLLGGDGVFFRMYPSGLGPLVEGWTKNLSGGARRAPLGRAAAATAWVALACWVLTLPLPWLVVGWIGYAAQLRWLLPRLGSFRWWTWAAWPVPLAAFVALFLGSLWKRVVRREVGWRGRRVPT